MGTGLIIPGYSELYEYVTVGEGDTDVFESFFFSFVEGVGDCDGSIMLITIGGCFEAVGVTELLAFSGVVGVGVGKEVNVGIEVPVGAGVFWAPV